MFIAHSTLSLDILHEKFLSNLLNKMICLVGCVCKIIPRMSELRARLKIFLWDIFFTNYHNQLFVKYSWLLAKAKLLPPFTSQSNFNCNQKLKLWIYSESKIITDQSIKFNKTWKIACNAITLVMKTLFNIAISLYFTTKSWLYHLDIFI